MECPTTEVPKMKSDDAPMECEMSEPQSVKGDDSSSDKGAVMLPVSGATSAAASTPDSEYATNPEEARVKDGALTLPISEATSASASTSASAECALSPEDSNLKIGAMTLSVSGATSAAVSTPVSECDQNPEEVRGKGALTLPISGATSAAVSTSMSDSGCAMSPEEAHLKGASTLPVSGATSAALSDSECVKSPDDTPSKVVADPLASPVPTAEAPVSASKAGHQEIMSAEKVAEMMLSPEKEKVGLFKGVKTAIKTKVKSVWKKLSPKKADRSALAVQEAESMDTSAPETVMKPETVKKPYKVETYVSATRGSLVCNSVASDEVTLDTDLPTSGSEVFLPDQESIATCDTATHASRLPSLGESSSEPSEESPEHNAERPEESPQSNAQESSGDRGDEAMEDENVAGSS